VMNSTGLPASRNTGAVSWLCAIATIGSSLPWTSRIGASAWAACFARDIGERSLSPFRAHAQDGLRVEHLERFGARRRVSRILNQFLGLDTPAIDTAQRQSPGWTVTPAATT
jgi:hypothetical protein